jgi:hypothetical protein
MKKSGQHPPRSFLKGLGTQARGQSYALDDFAPSAAGFTTTQLAFQGALYPALSHFASLVNCPAVFDFPGSGLPLPTLDFQRFDACGAF